MPAHFEFTSPDIARLQELFETRAATMVRLAQEEGERRAEAYAASGGRHRTHPGRYLRRHDRPMRTRHATGNQKVRMIERVLYRRFADFFGDW